MCHTCRDCSLRTSAMRDCGASGSRTVSGSSLNFALQMASIRPRSTCMHPHGLLNGLAWDFWKGYQVR